MKSQLYAFLKFCKFVKITAHNLAAFLSMLSILFNSSTSMHLVDYFTIFKSFTNGLANLFKKQQILLCFALIMVSHYY